MSQRELVDNLIRHKQGERIGLMDNPWPDTLAAWMKEGYPTRMVYREVGEERWTGAGLPLVACRSTCMVDSICGIMPRDN